MLCNKRLLAASILATVAVAAPAFGAIVIDDFNTNEGHFALDPDFSDSTSGLVETSNGVGASTADRTTVASEVFEGAGAEKLALTSGSYFTTTGGATPQNRTGFFVRFLSGSGTPANNTVIPVAGNKVQIYAATTSSDIQIAPAFDDGASLERALYQTLISDGQYHLYEFNLSAATARFAGSGGTANALDGPNVTLDSIFITSAVNQPGTVTVLLDSIQYDAVPEPVTGVMSAAIAGLMLRRIRR